MFQRVDDMGLNDEADDCIFDGLQPSDFPENDPTMQGAAAVAACPPDIILESCSTETVYRSSCSVVKALEDATSKLRDHKVQALLQQPIAEEEEPTMHLQYDASGRVVGAVVTMVPCPASRAEMAAATNVKAGEAMPYIRLPKEELPNVANTSQLHLLSDEQEFAFRLIMDTMDKHLQKEENVPQLTMSILGSAGEKEIIMLCTYDDK